MKNAGVQSVHILLELAQLRWTTHVTRMQFRGERAPSVAKVLKCSIDTLNASLKDFNITTA